MAEPESLNTMFQNSFQKIADGEYALQTTGVSGGTPTEVGIDPDANTVKLDQTDPNNKVRIADGQIITIAQPLASRLTSAFANGKQAAPAAATAIATTADLSAGTWDIEARIAILGTTVANVETDNTRFYIGAGIVATPTVNVPGTTGSTASCEFRCRVDIDVATPVSIRSGPVAATAGSIYVADIVATKYEGV